MSPITTKVEGKTNSTTFSQLATNDGKTTGYLTKN